VREEEVPNTNAASLPPPSSHPEENPGDLWMPLCRRQFQRGLAQDILCIYITLSFQ